jgi:hypothetical protein
MPLLIWRLIFGLAVLGFFVSACFFWIAALLLDYAVATVKTTREFIDIVRENSREMVADYRKKVGKE